MWIQMDGRIFEEETSKKKLEGSYFGRGIYIEICDKMYLIPFQIQIEVNRQGTFCGLGRKHNGTKVDQRRGRDRKGSL